MLNEKILIIIPAYNEAECIERVVDDLIRHYPQYAARYRPYYLPPVQNPFL